MGLGAYLVVTVVGAPLVLVGGPVAAGVAGVRTMVIVHVFVFLWFPTATLHHSCSSSAVVLVSWLAVDFFL